VIDEAYLRATSSFQLQQQQQQQLSPRIKGFEFYLFICISGEWKGRDFLISLLSVGRRLSIIIISREKGREGVMSAT
jgi:hypothetical protein